MYLQPVANILHGNRYGEGVDKPCTARSNLKDHHTIGSHIILYPVLQALNKAIGSTKIAFSNFAVTRLALLALSATYSSQPLFIYIYNVTLVGAQLYSGT
jgi:hypothetical protein